jgi:hypothetical protein
MDWMGLDGIGFVLLTRDDNDNNNNNHDNNNKNNNINNDNNLLKAADTLRAPNWIIDVTRPHKAHKACAPHWIIESLM